ncbi:MAG: hypothetical protein Q8O65_02920 [Nitrosopumilaceae archaeon]|nr:hypothetical protein [Nitrosopumilaceae archaeon]
MKHPKKKIEKKPYSDYFTNLPHVGEPPINENDKSDVQQKIDILFWIRVGLAVLGGTLATFLFEPFEGEERRFASIVLLIAIFITSVGIAKGMRIQLPPSDKKKLFTTGIGSYIFIYLFMWILTYTFVHAGGNGGFPLTPFT